MHHSLKLGDVDPMWSDRDKPEEIMRARKAVCEGIGPLIAQFGQDAISAYRCTNCHTLLLTECR